ncbi:MAG: hypothetical protein K9G59_07695 [Caulobacter sp.]|nr:hypothetical protein [Caulobacter sp.]
MHAQVSIRPISEVKGQHLRRVENWGLKVLKIERLLDLASDQVGEDIPYSATTAPGLDRLDATIDGIAALVRELRAELVEGTADVEA